jgi:hypothetical protein
MAIHKCGLEYSQKLTKHNNQNIRLFCAELLNKKLYLQVDKPDVNQYCENISALGVNI